MEVGSCGSPVPNAKLAVVDGLNIAVGASENKLQDFPVIKIGEISSFMYQSIITLS